MCFATHANGAPEQRVPGFSITLGAVREALWRDRPSKQGSACSFSRRMAVVPFTTLAAMMRSAFQLTRYKFAQQARQDLPTYRYKTAAPSPESEFALKEERETRHSSVQAAR